MDFKEAMQKRHMVRKYTDKPLSDEIIAKINERIELNNKTYNLNMKLMINNSKGVSSIMKLIMAKGVNNFIILAGDVSENLDERLGYSGAAYNVICTNAGIKYMVGWWNF